MPNPTHRVTTCRSIECNLCNRAARFCVTAPGERFDLGGNEGFGASRHAAGPGLYSLCAHGAAGASPPFGCRSRWRNKIIVREPQALCSLLPKGPAPRACKASQPPPRPPHVSPCSFLFDGMGSLVRTLLAVGSEPPCSCYPGLADGQGFRRAFAALNPNDKEKTSSATPSVPKSAEQALFLPLNRLKKSCGQHRRSRPAAKPRRRSRDQRQGQADRRLPRDRRRRPPPRSRSASSASRSQATSRSAVCSPRQAARLSQPRRERHPQRHASRRPVRSPSKPCTIRA